MKDVTVAGNRYRIGRLGSIDQLHVASKLYRVLLLMSEADPKVATPRKFARAMLAMTGEMNQLDADLTLATCLGVVQREQGGKWPPIWPPGGTIMFQDLGPMELLELQYHVLEEHDFKGFFGDDPSGSPEPGGAAEKASA